MTNLDKPENSSNEFEENDAPQLKSRPAIPKLDIDAIIESSGKCNEEAEALSSSLLASGNFAQAIVVNLDIRSSTTFMLHVEDFVDYADSLSRFINYVKQSCIGNGGLFDKFTGDGAMFFWLSALSRKFGDVFLY